MTHDHPLIVVEGIDASGKATLCKALSRLYGARVFSFPNYKTQTGKALLGHLKGEWYAARCPEGVWLNSLVRQALMTANRCEMQGAILDALKEAKVTAEIGDTLAVLARLDGVRNIALGGFDDDEVCSLVGAAADALRERLLFGREPVARGIAIEDLARPPVKLKEACGPLENFRTQITLAQKGSEFTFIGWTEMKVLISHSIQLLPKTSIM